MQLSGKSNFIRNGTITFSEQLVRLGLQLIGLILVSRLTSSDVFGVYALMIALSTGLLCVTQFNVDSYLTANPNISDKAQGSIWSFLVVVNISAGITLIVLANSLHVSNSNFYIILGTIFTLFAWSIGSLPRAKLLSSGEFKQLFIIGILGSLTNLILSVSLLLILENGQIALMISQVSAVMVSSLAAIYLGKGNLKLGSPFTVPKTILMDFKHTTQTLLANFLSRNLDTFLIYFAMGASALGYYDRAYFLMLAAQQFLSQVLGRIIVKDLAKFQGEDLDRRFLVLTELYVFAAILIFAPFIFFPDTLVNLLLGSNFEPSTDIVRVLGLVGVLQSILATSGYYYLRKENLKAQATVTLQTASIYIMSFSLIPLINLKIVTFALANFLASLIAILVVYLSLSRISLTSFRSYTWFYSKRFLINIVHITIIFGSIKYFLEVPPILQISLGYLLLFITYYYKKSPLKRFRPVMLKGESRA